MLCRERLRIVNDKVVHMFRPMNALTTHFRDAVQAFLDRTGTAPLRLGKEARGRSVLRAPADAGGEPRLDTADRVLAFMGEAPDGPVFRAEVEAFVEVSGYRRSRGSARWSARHPGKRRKRNVRIARRPSGAANLPRRTGSPRRPNATGGAAWSSSFEGAAPVTAAAFDTNPAGRHPAGTPFQAVRDGLVDDPGLQ